MSSVNYKISFNVYDSSFIKIGEVEITIDGILAEIEKDLPEIKKAMNSIKKEIKDTVEDK